MEPDKYKNKPWEMITCWVDQKQMVIHSNVRYDERNLNRNIRYLIKMPSVKMHGKQGPIKPSVGPGPNVNSGPHSKSFKKVEFLS